MKTINIKAHFEQEKRSHEELVAKAKEEMESVKNEFALNARENSKLEGEKRKFEHLLEQNEKAGLGVQELKEKIVSLDSKMANLTRSQAALQETERKCIATINRSLERENLVVSRT